MMKTEFKGTPGPWKPDYISGVCVGVGRQIQPGYIQMIVNTILPETDEEYRKQRMEIESNVRLIAAAPEMLAALQEIIRQHDLDAENTLLPPIPNRWMDAISKAEKAINKVLGR
ncbi:MAG: hypothetical protein ACLTW0_02080 [Alistipes ihumii]|jgi:hypothetical protein|uniref:hypothetical protein n=1 Tax=Alistipes ihumii TaxID=1470347 RepID=UPI003993F8FA